MNTAALNPTPVQTREVVQCVHCRLTQFRTASGRCRKCRQSLNAGDPVVAAPVVFKEPAQTTVTQTMPGIVLVPEQSPDVGFAVRLLRLARSMSQMDMARKGGWARSYISKIENRTAVPTIENICRFADALEVPVAVLITFATFHMYYRVDLEGRSA